MNMIADIEFMPQVEAFATDVLARSAGRWSMGEALDSSIFMKAAELGLFGIEMPRKLGGLAMKFTAKAKICEILASEDFGFAMSVINTHNVAVRLTASGSDGLQSKYLPGLLSGRISACTALTEPSTGTDFAAITCRAVRTVSGWKISGEKSWIVNARHAGLAVVFAQCGKESGPSHIGAFLVDLNADGVSRYAIDTPFSQTSIATGGFILDEVTLDEDNLLLLPRNAFKEILNEINGARIYVAAMCHGMLSNAIRQAENYGRVRHSFGKPLNAYPDWQSSIDEATSANESIKRIFNKAITQFESGGDSQLLAAQAKIAAVEANQRHLPQLLHAMGAEGLRPQYCFSRHLAATQLASLTDGATSMLKSRVKKLLFQKTQKKSERR